MPGTAASGSAREADLVRAWPGTYAHSRCATYERRPRTRRGRFHIAFTGSSLERNAWPRRSREAAERWKLSTVPAGLENGAALIVADLAPVYAGRLEIRPADHAALVDGRPLDPDRARAAAPDRAGPERRAGDDP